MASVIIGITLQLVSVAFAFRVCRSQSRFLVGPWMFAVLFAYHGMTSIGVNVTDTQSPAYAWLPDEVSESAHLTSGFLAVALSSGYCAIVALILGRAPGSPPSTNAPTGSGLVLGRLELALWTGVLFLVIQQTIAGGLYFDRTNPDLHTGNYWVRATQYFLYPTLALCGILWYFRASFARVNPVLRYLPLVACFVLTALTGRRSWVFYVLLSIYLALQSLGARRLLTRKLKLTAVGLGLTILVVFVPFRAFLGGRGAEFTGFGSLLSQYATFLSNPLPWFDSGLIMQDLSQRADGHVFLSRVMAGQTTAGLLSGDCFSASLSFAVPGYLWPEKENKSLEYCEQLAIHAYDMPQMDYTPTLFGEVVADTGPLLAMPFFLLLGVALALAEALAAARSPFFRIFFYTAFGQTLLQVESGLVGFLLGLRTLAALWTLALVFRWFGEFLKRTPPKRPHVEQAP